VTKASKPSGNDKRSLHFYQRSGQHDLDRSLVLEDAFELMPRLFVLVAAELEGPMPVTSIGYACDFRRRCACNCAAPTNIVVGAT